MGQKIIPGVYTEEIDSGPRPISSISTGVIGIIGTAPKGPVDEARLVSSFAEFERIYGGIDSSNTLANDARLAFENGAQAIRACRVVGSGAVKATKVLQDDASADTLELTAKGYGSDGNGLEVTVATGTTGGRVTVTVQNTGNGMTEQYQNGCMGAGEDNYLVDMINADSEMVDAADKGSTGNPETQADTPLEGGYDGGSAGAGEIIGQTNPNSGLKLLETLDDVNILMAAQNADASVWAEMIAQCERMLDRICILNPSTSLTPTQLVATLSSIESKRAVMVYPWVTVYDYATGATKDVAPAAAMAGVLSRIDAYRSPSNEKIESVLGVQRALTRAEVEYLHQNRVTCISLLTGRGFRFRNGITLSSDPKWVQICKRRELDKIEESVEEAMSWAISRPHTATLRDSIKTSVSNFLSTLVAQGEIGSGYTVKCDSDNNTPASIQAGYLICDVGIEFLYPADKVVFRYSENIGEGFTATQVA